MRHLTSLWIGMHRRGIQAILVAGCLLGFGLGQALGATYGPHADRAVHVPSGGVGALVGANRATSGLGNTVGGQQGTGAQQQRPAASHATPTPQVVGASRRTATQAQGASSNDHQADRDGSQDNGQRKGKGHDGEKSPKTKGHRTGNDGGTDKKQGKDSSNQGANSSDGDKHDHGSHGDHGG